MLFKVIFKSLRILFVFVILCYFTGYNVQAATVPMTSSSEYAEVALKYGRISSAIIAYTKAIRENPNDVSLYVNRAMCFIESGRKDFLKDAMEDCEKALLLQTDLPIAYATKGFVYIKMGEYKKALLLCEKAVNMEPSSLDINYGLAVCYQALGKNEEALVVYNKVLGLDSEYYAAYVNGGFAYLALKNTAKAIEYFSNAIKLQPLDKQLYYNRAMAYEMAGDLKLAESDYKKFHAMKQEDQ